MEMYLCLRYPPAPRPNDGKVSVYPVVRVDDWCGEYQLRHRQQEIR